jgi:hypothetical protein
MNTQQLTPQELQLASKQFYAKQSNISFADDVVSPEYIERQNNLLKATEGHVDRALNNLLSSTEELNDFCKRFKLNYVLNPQNIAYFLVTEISLSLEKSKDDFANNYIGSPSGQERLKNNTIRLLEGESLKQFKAAYKEQIGPLTDSLKFTSKLYVCTLDVLKDYLFRPAADAQKLLIRGMSNSQYRQIIQENLETSNSPTNPHFTSEESLHQALAYLSTFGNYRLFSELSISDISAAKQKHRRLDLTHISYSKGQKYVTIYELKKGQIDDITLQESLAKNYILLAQNHFKTPNVRLIYIAPDYATQGAINLVQYSKDIEIMQLKDFVNLLLKYAARLHKKDPYYIKEMLPKTNTLKALMF